MICVLYHVFVFNLHYFLVEDQLKIINCYWCRTYIKSWLCWLTLVKMSGAKLGFRVTSHKRQGVSNHRQYWTAYSTVCEEIMSLAYQQHPDQASESSLVDHSQPVRTAHPRIWTATNPFSVLSVNFYPRHPQTPMCWYEVMLFVTVSLIYWSPIPVVRIPWFLPAWREPAFPGGLHKKPRCCCHVLVLLLLGRESPMSRNDVIGEPNACKRFVESIPYFKIT